MKKSPSNSPKNLQAFFMGMCTDIFLRLHRPGRLGPNSQPAPFLFLGREECNDFLPGRAGVYHPPKRWVSTEQHGGSKPSALRGWVSPFGWRVLRSGTLFMPSPVGELIASDSRVCKANIEGTAERWMRSCVALMAPHPSAYGCHLPPLGKDWITLLPSLPT